MKTLYLTLFLYGIYSIAQADVFTSSAGGGLGSWEVNGDWVGSTKPSAVLLNDAITITAGDSIVRPSALTISNNVVLGVNGILLVNGSLIANNTLNLNVAGKLIVNGTLTINNNLGLIVDPGGVVEVNGSVNLGNNIVSSMNGTMTIDGSLSVGNTNLQGNGVLTISGAGCSAWDGPGGCSDVLPIELVSFEGESYGEEALLTWITATEENNDYFVVERSMDGVSFEQIGIVGGNGTTYKTIHYEFVDKKPKSGINYYRLLQIDFDGTGTYTDLIYVNKSLNSIKPDCKVYPNPSHNGKLFINLNDKLNMTEALFVHIKSLDGEMLYEDEFEAMEKVTLNVDGLGHGGIYILEVVWGNTVHKERVVLH